MLVFFPFRVNLYNFVSAVSEGRMDFFLSKVLLDMISSQLKKINDVIADTMVGLKFFSGPCALDVLML